MALRLVMLEQARASLAFGQQQFEEEFDGSFFLAIGLVAAEPMPARRKPRFVKRTQELSRIHVENTYSMNTGERLIHSLNDHPLAGCTFFLPASETAPQRVGRRPDLDLTVPDISVSDLHCELHPGEAGAMNVVDLDSTNGTLINLKRLEPGTPTLLRNEEVLTVGRYSLQYFVAASLFDAMQVLNQVQ